MKARFFTKGLAVLAGAALVFILSLQGCSTKPTEAPSTTVITGTAQLSVSSGDNRDSYSFVSGGINYGKLTLVYYTPTVLGMEAVGIMAGTGTTAPDTGYSTSATVTVGQSYFVKTDNAVHYARITITSQKEDAGSGYTTVGFQWVLQTEANNRNLY